MTQICIALWIGTKKVYNEILLECGSTDNIDRVICRLKTHPVSYAIWIISNAERANNAALFAHISNRAAREHREPARLLATIKESEGLFDVDLRHWINSLCASLSLAAAVCARHTQNTGGQLNIVTIWLFVFPLSRASDRLVKKSAEPNEFNERNFIRARTLPVYHFNFALCVFALLAP